MMPRRRFSFFVVVLSGLVWSVCRSVSLSVSLSHCLSLSLSVSICLSLCLSLSLSLSLSVPLCLSVSVSVCFCLVNNCTALSPHASEAATLPKFRVEPLPSTCVRPSSHSSPSPWIQERVQYAITHNRLTAHSDVLAPVVSISMDSRGGASRVLRNQWDPLE